MSKEKITPVPDGWLREIGILNPTAPKPEEKEAAWKQLEEDLPLVTSMVEDIHQAIETLLAIPDLSANQQIFLKRILPMSAQSLTRDRRAHV